MTQAKASVLIVDDAPLNIKIAAEALREHYDVRFATGGQAALNLLQQSTLPDLILLDVMMPDMDGYEVCRRLKQDRKTKDIPVIFLSALDDVAGQTKGFSLGAVDYVTKPFQLPLLLMRVALHIRLKRKAERLEQLALIDWLTEIPNRRALEAGLAREWDRARRNRTSLAVVMADVDAFKAYNDHYGHGAGDEVLRRVAHAMGRDLNRPGDVLARYGGEEFCAVLPDTDASGALHMAEHMREAVAALGIVHAHSSVAPCLTVSLGVAVVSPGSVGAATLEEVLQRADRALYEAKSQGSNRVVLAATAA